MKQAMQSAGAHTAMPGYASNAIKYMSLNKMDTEDVWRGTVRSAI
jgi:hypothetical protein